MERRLLEREMSRLFEEHTMYDSMKSLAAFQAYLVYAMTLFFQFDNLQTSGLHEPVVNLQQMASSSVRQGVVTPAEFDHSRPAFTSWIVAEAKRRTLYTMYLFDNLLCVTDNMPVFIGTELRGLPAPASKYLWRATSEEEWKSSYNSFLSQWDRSGLRIDEVWPLPPSLSQHEVLEQRRRIDQWAEGVDEYGTMLCAVTTCTHGG